MKKMFILLLALASIVWAKIDIEAPVRVEELPWEWFDWDRFSEEYWNKCWAELDESVCRVCEDALCPMILDSNILYGLRDFSGFVEIYILTGATHSWREAFEYLINYYRKCCLMDIDDSTYNALFANIDSVLVPEINKYLQSDGKYSKPLIYRHDMGVMQGGYRTPGPNYELIEFALDSVNARNAVISGIAPAKYKLESIRVQNHQLSVSPELLGRKFTLFDVNGHELRRGTLQNNMQLPAYPTVIKIQGFGTKLLNSR